MLQNVINDNNGQTNIKRMDGHHDQFMYIQINNASHKRGGIKAITRLSEKLLTTNPFFFPLFVSALTVGLVSDIDIAMAICKSASYWLLKHDSDKLVYQLLHHRRRISYCFQNTETLNNTLMSVLLVRFTMQPAFILVFGLFL